MENIENKLGEDPLAGVSADVGGYLMYVSPIKERTRAELIADEIEREDSLGGLSICFRCVPCDGNQGEYRTSRLNETQKVDLYKI